MWLIIHVFAVQWAQMHNSQYIETHNQCIQLLVEARYLNLFVRFNPFACRFMTSGASLTADVVAVSHTASFPALLPGVVKDCHACDI